MRGVIFWLVILYSISGKAGEIPQVPSNVEIAGVKLKITNEARLEIQKDVNALRASDRYFQIKLDRINLYFPIIERVLKEEGVPDDLKYLSVQESALISDAASVADAVGYWQFKDFTAREVGLRVDNKVDERKNIVSASQGAAKYFKRNNFMFKNWIYAVSAYQAGPGGAKRYVDKENFGSDKLTIDKNTHWYVLRFIAHVIAFRDAIGGDHSEGLKLVEYTNGANKDLDQIARQFNVDHQLLKDYNKWLAHGKVPDDKIYAVIIPVTGKVKLPKEDEELPPLARSIKEPEPTRFPDEIIADLSDKKAILIRINGIEAVMAGAGDDLVKLALKTGVSSTRLEKYNDLRPGQRIRPGEIYYTRNKKNKSPIRYHVVQHGETLWDISQKYGIKLKKLAAKNRMEMTDEVKPGRVMWLRKTRSTKIPVEYHEVKKQQPAQKPEPVQVVKTEAPKETLKTEPVISVEEQKEVTPREEKPIKTEQLPKDPEPDMDPYPLTTHTVEAGESIWSISRRYDMLIDETLAINKLRAESIISPGQLIKVKAGIPEESQPELLTENHASANNAGANSHEVRAGESLWSISREYHITVEELMNWNNLTTSNVLSIGQKLIIKSAQTATGPVYIIYVVKGGDSLYKIANTYQMTIEELMELNELQSSALSIGDELKVIRR